MGKMCLDTEGPKSGKLDLASEGIIRGPGELGVEMLKCPGFSYGLPGSGGQVDHFLTTPSIP